MNLNQMKTLKIHVLFLLTTAQFSYAQFSTELKTANDERSNQGVCSKDKRSLNLSIPMIGNVSIRNASPNVRTATLALQVPSNSYITEGLISETKQQPKQPNELSKPISGGKQIERGW
jgi:hypothetical protein